MTDYKNLKLIATSNPHIRDNDTTRSIMLDVIIAMLPALIWSVVEFGFRAITVTAVSVAGCVFFEWLYRKLLKKPQSVGDLSAVVTGMLLSFVCPVNVAYWQILIGGAFSIIMVKQLFGGIGKNFLNPALAGRAFLLASYAAIMGRYAVPKALTAAVDGVTMATPLSYLYSGAAMPGYMGFKSLLLGTIPGCIGELSTLALLIGGAYLLATKVISWRIPGAYLGTVAVLCLIFGHEGYGNVDWMLYNLMSGGLMLGAIFMATDYATSPVTLNGQLLYGVGCGALTVLIRYFGGFPEGVTYAILIMNLCTWAIDKGFHRHQFGVTKEDIAAEKAAKKAAKEAAK